MEERVVIPLPLNDSLAESLVSWLCDSTTMWSLLAEHIDPAEVSHRLSRTVLEAAKAVAERQSGNGPGSWLVVLQELRQQHTNGGLTVDDVFAAAEMLHRARLERPPEESVLTVVKPMLRDRARTHALDKLIAGGDELEAADALVKASVIGEAKTTTVGLLDVDRDLDMIADADRVATLPTPIIPLTAKLGGGLAVRNLGAVSGHSGSGKSVFLNHQAAVACVLGHFTGCLTAELVREHWASRFYGALTGVDEKSLRRNDKDARRAVHRAMDALPNRGPVTIDRFAAHAFTLQDVREYIDKCEQRVGEPMRVLIVDYADKLSVRGEPSEYKAMRVVYEGLREIAESRSMWIWTASQPQRSAGGGLDNMNGIINLNELADSQHKVRALDTLVTINKREEGKSRAYWIAKHRLDGGDEMVGPYPPAFAQGRIVSTTPLAAAYARTSFSSWPEDVQVDELRARLA